MVRLAAAALALAITSLGLSARGAESQILLLDFWSPQCGPCMGMKPTMHALEQASYPIREIDTTRDFQTSQQYNVHSIPCFVMLVDGQEVQRQVGATSIQELQQMFDKAKDIVVQRQRARGQSPDSIASPHPAAGAQNRSAGPAPRPEADSVPERDPWNQSAAVPAHATPAYPASPAAGSAADGDFPSNLIAATVRIRVEDPQGRSFGTGTIIDSRSGEALICTCGHLFRESKGKGPMTIDMFDVGRGGLQLVGQFPGQLISYDLDRDIAFVSFKPDRQVRVATVAPPHTPIDRSDRVATIGCSNGKDPTLLPQRINALDRYHGPPNIEVSGAPEEGRSGGGLFNLQGQLIGICYAADYEGKEGLYTALESIHGELDRLHLSDIYAKPDGLAKPVDNASQPVVIRGQEPPLPPIAPIADAKPTPAQNLSDAEQAAFGEIMQRATTSEVVVIVRPKTPGGQSEVITLDNVSPEFVQALEARRRSSQAPVAR
jgi:thiol-disulfide isomerase/thioredoxin